MSYQEQRKPETANLRKRIDQMTDEEKNIALLVSRKTGLPNIQDFEEHNDPALGGSPAPAVGMSDVDGLKAFNDRYGYAAGDTLLRAKADALQAVVRKAGERKRDTAQHPDRSEGQADRTNSRLQGC